MIKSILCFCALVLAAAPTFQDPQTKPVKQHAIRFDGSVMTVMPVRDILAAKKWYCETLGQKVVLDLSEMGFCEVTSPTKGALIGLEQVRKGETFKTNGAASLSLGTTNIRAAKAWMDKRGIKTEAIVVIPETVQLLNFYDPDGNRLTLYQAPPAKAADAASETATKTKK